MKKVIYTLIVMCCWAVTQGQYCGGSGSGVCTPAAPTGTPGLRPLADSLPCAVKGVPYSATIQFENFTSAGGYPLNWLRIDTIANLPPGLCWKTNSTNNQFNSGATGCIYVSGTPLINATAGQYKLRIIVTANVTAFGFPVTQSNVNAESQGLYYWARLKCSNLAPCPDIDTLTGKTTNIIPYTNPSPTVNISPTAATLCPGASLTINSGATGAAAYKWSNGATTSSISVTSAGTYRVTAYGACGDSVVSANSIVTNGAFTTSITPASPTFCPGGTVTLTALPAGAAYAWSGGGSAATKVVSTAGSYSVTVTQSGCTASATTTVTQSSALSPTITSSSSIICPGSTVTLDAGSGYSTYSWSAGSTTQTQSVTSQGTYSVTVSQGGCTGSGSINLVNGVNITNPTITPAVTSTCAGQSVSLAADTGYTTYVWSSGGSNSATNTVSGPGTYTLSVTKTGYCGTGTATTTINTNPTITNPTITANPQSVCAGDPVALSTSSAYTTYVWSAGTSTTNTNSVFGAGTYAISVTQTGTCGVGTATVTVNTTPNTPTPALAANPPAACPTETVILTADTGFTTYTWSPGTSISNINTVTGSGTYTVTVTKTGTCGNATASLFVSGGSITCSASNSGNTLSALPAGATYQWQLNGTPISGAVAQTYTATASGNYTCAVTQNGCICTTNSVGLNVGISNIAAEIDYLIAPNPTAGELSLSYSLSQYSKVNIYIADINGKTVRQLTNENQNKGKYNLAVSIADVPTGVYFVTIVTDKGKATHKLIKE